MDAGRMSGRARGDEHGDAAVPLRSTGRSCDMDRRLDSPEEFHLRAAVERLVRAGCSQDEIEETLARMLGGRRAGPSVTTRLRRLVSR
jgi:hypothetical protein